MGKKYSNFKMENIVGDTLSARIYYGSVDITQTFLFGLIKLEPKNHNIFWGFAESMKFLDSGEYLIGCPNVVTQSWFAKHYIDESKATPIWFKEYKNAM